MKSGVRFGERLYVRHSVDCPAVLKQAPFQPFKNAPERIAKTE